MFQHLVCRLGGHKINRRRVWFDGLDFRTNCERCGTPLLRDTDGWRAFDTQSDLAANREPHPRHRMDH